MTRAIALVEISAGSNGEVPSDLVQAVYRASADGLFILALHGVDADAIDRSLDGVVCSMPLNIPGVIYVDAEDETAMRAALGATEQIFSTSFAFRMRIERIGFERQDSMGVGCPIAALIASGFDRMTGSLRERQPPDYAPPPPPDAQVIMAQAR